MEVVRRMEHLNAGSGSRRHGLKRRVARGGLGSDRSSAQTTVNGIPVALTATVPEPALKCFAKTHPKVEGGDDVIGRDVRACRGPLGGLTALGLPTATQAGPPAFRVTSDLEADLTEGREGAEPSNGPTAVTLCDQNAPANSQPKAGIDE